MTFVRLSYFDFCNRVGHGTLFLYIGVLCGCGYVAVIDYTIIIYGCCFVVAFSLARTTAYFFKDINILMQDSW